MSRGLLEFIVDVGCLMYVGYASHKEGYRQGQQDLVQQATLFEMQQMREEIERLKREKNNQWK